jgi:hypothetical protein
MPYPPISEMQRIAAAQQRRNARAEAVFSVMLLPLGFGLVLGAFRIVGEAVFIASGSLILATVGLAFIADRVFARRDRAHPFLEPGLSCTEYEFIQAEGDADDAGEGERRADASTSKTDATAACSRDWASGPGFFDYLSERDIEDINRAEAVYRKNVKDAPADSGAPK